MLEAVKHLLTHELELGVGLGEDLLGLGGIGSSSGVVVVVAVLLVLVVVVCVVGCDGGRGSPFYI